MFADSAPQGPPRSLGPTEPEPAAGQPAAAATTANLLGLTDPELELDDLKDAAIQELTSTAGNRQKRPKLTHSMFFDQDDGLKKVMKTFPKIKFQGKGHEFDDLKLLLRNYERWFKELYPFGEHFEDMVWKAREKLQERERDEDGIDSDPRERLHMLRFTYKNMSPEELETVTTSAKKKELSDDVKRKIEENRQRALALKQKKAAKQNGAPTPSAMDMETQWLIEEKRARALELRQQKLAQTAASQKPAPHDPDEEEDPFGYGAFGVDDDTSAGVRPAMQQPPKPAAMVSDEDLFGPPQPPAPSFEEEEDPFGFGGFDEP